MAQDQEPVKAGGVIQIDEKPIQEHLGEMVRAKTMQGIHRRTRVVGAFPDGRSALMLVAARLRHIANSQWGKRRYLDMDKLKEVAVGAA